MSKHSYSSQDRNSEQTRRRVQQWMMDMGYSVKQESAAGTQWVLMATLPDNIGFAVVQEPNKPDRMVVQAGLDISPEHQGLILELSPEERRAFMWDIRFGLLATSVEFKMEGEPLARIAIGKPLYLEGLNKNTFAQSAQEVRCAALLVLWKLNQKAENGGGGELSDIRVN